MPSQGFPLHNFRSKLPILLPHLHLNAGYVQSPGYKNPAAAGEQRDNVLFQMCPSGGSFSPSGQQLCAISDIIWDLLVQEQHGIRWIPLLLMSAKMPRRHVRIKEMLHLSSEATSTLGWLAGVSRLCASAAAC